MLHVKNIISTIQMYHLKVSDVFAPIDPGTESQLFISKSYDPTSHFETTCLVNSNVTCQLFILQYYYEPTFQDVLDIFKRGTGEDFDFSKVKININILKDFYEIEDCNSVELIPFLISCKLMKGFLFSGETHP